MTDERLDTVAGCADAVRLMQLYYTSREHAAATDMILRLQADEGTREAAALIGLSTVLAAVSNWLNAGELSPPGPAVTLAAWTQDGSPLLRRPNPYLQESAACLGLGVTAADHPLGRLAGADDADGAAVSLVRLLGREMPVALLAAVDAVDRALGALRVEQGVTALEALTQIGHNASLVTSAAHAEVPRGEQSTLLRDVAVSDGTPLDGLSLDREDLDAWFVEELHTRLQRQPFWLEVAADRFETRVTVITPELSEEFEELGGVAGLRRVRGLAWADLDDSDRRLVSIALVDHISVEARGRTVREQVTFHWRL